MKVEVIVDGRLALKSERMASLSAAVAFADNREGNFLSNKKEYSKHVLSNGDIVRVKYTTTGKKKKKKSWNIFDRAKEKEPSCPIGLE